MTVYAQPGSQILTDQNPHIENIQKIKVADNPKAGLEKAVSTNEKIDAGIVRRRNGSQSQIGD